MIGRKTGHRLPVRPRGANRTMPKKSKNFLDHANDLATEIADKIGPQVESAVETAREKAGPVIVEAREKAAPVVAEARDKITTDVLPVIAAAIVAADERTEPFRDETKRRGKATVAALKGEIEAPKPKRHWFRNTLLVLGLLGIAGFVAKRLSDRPSTTTWESTPAPAPAAPASSGSSTSGSSSGSSASSSAGAHRAETTDQGGASPDVAAADAAAEPHDVTTPDNPAETIDVKRD